MCHLNGLKNDFAVHHAEIWPEVFGKTIVPVFEVAIWSTGCHLAIASLRPRHSVVEAVLGTEATIELILKAVHEGSVAGRLRLVVPDAPVANDASVAVMESPWFLVARRATTSSSCFQFVPLAVEVHPTNY